MKIPNIPQLLRQTAGELMSRKGLCLMIVLFPLSLEASVNVTNSQVYVFGSGYAGYSPADTDSFTYTTPATGTQIWNPSLSVAKDGFYASAVSNLQSTVGLTEFTFATMGSGMSWVASGPTTNVNLTLRFSMNFTVSTPMEAEFSLSADIGGNIARSVTLQLNEDSTSVVSLARSSVGSLPDLSDEHLLLPGKSYYFSVTYTGEGNGSAFDSYSSSISSASGSMSVLAVPEPSTVLLAALGAGALLLRRRRAGAIPVPVKG